MRLSLLSIILIIPFTAFSQNNIAVCEYWFDSDRGSLQQVITQDSPSVYCNSDIDISGLDDGLHTFHIRFGDGNGSWTGVVSRFFIKDERAEQSGTAMITKMQYWFDSDYSTAVTTDIEDASSAAISSDLSVSDLGDGLHTVHLRFAGSDSRWSGTVSRFFVKRSAEPSSLNRELERIEYWFDNNLSEMAATGTAGDQLNISEFIDLPGLPDGLHTIGLRVVDGQGIGSSAITRFFIIRSLTEPEGNTITGYRYWVNDTLVESVIIPEESPSVISIDTLDLRLYPGGEYTVNFQFRDSHGFWSGAAYDTILKISYPYAVIEASPVAVCAGDSILFTAMAVDTDSLKWDFGDGIYADSLSTWHTYTEGGNYQVAISVSDTTEDITTYLTYPDPAKVFSLPIINLGDPLTISEDESVVLDAGAGYASYLWNDTGGGSLYTVSGSTLGTGVHQVWATIEDENGCSATDTLEVTVTLSSGIEGAAEVTLRVYPNPVDDYLRIDWKNRELRNPTVSLVDESGRVLINQQPIYNGREIDLSGVIPGSYLLVISFDGASRSTRIIKR